MFKNPDETAVGLPCPPEEIDLFISRPTAGVLRTAAGIEGDVLVLGAAGKMGLHVSLMLQSALRQSGRDNRVIGVSRFTTLIDREQFAQHGIDTITCDLSMDEQLEALPDAQNVIFMAGIKFGTSSSPDLLHRMNVEMPRKVAQKYRKARIAAFSTGCVYPFVSFESGGAREEDPTGGLGEYAVSCQGREKAFFEASEQYGMRCSLIRLNYSVEFRYGVLVDIAKRVIDGEPIDVTMGYVNLIWQGDAVSHSIQSLDHAASPAFVLNVTGPDVYRVRWLAEEFGRRFGKEPRLVGAEESTAWLSNPSKSHRLMGKPEVSIHQMIDWIAGWITQGGETWNKPTGFEKRDGQY